MIVTIKEVKDDLDFEKKPCVSFLSDKDDKWRRGNIKFKPLLTGTVELAYDRSGKYPVLIDVKPATAQQAVTEDKSSDFATFHLRQKSIERQCCLHCAVDLSPGVDIAKVLETAEYFFQWLTDGSRPAPKATSPTLQEATEAFEKINEPVMSCKTPEDFKKSVNDFCRQQKWNKKDLENFMKAHEKKLGGKTDASLLDTAEQAILLTLLMKEVK